MRADSLSPLRAALLQGRARPQCAGDSPTARRHDGFEFAVLRDYVAGDDPRIIDWAATARAGRMQSRVRIECAEVCFSAVLDTSASMGVGRIRPLSEAAATILRAWYEAAQSGDRHVRVLESRVFEPQGRGAANGAARFPDRWLPGGPGMAGALDTALRVLPRGAALLVIGDFFDVSTTAASFARAGARFDCTALVAEDPWTGDLPLRGFTRVHDAETHRT